MKTGQIELKFEIGAYTPDTIPMHRLAEYMVDLAKLLGAESQVHFVKVKKGSTVIVHRADIEAYPTIRKRANAAKDRDAPVEIRQAFERIEQRLRQDNAKGAKLISPDMKLLEFRVSPSASRYPTVSKQGRITGVVMRIGGKGDWVPVHLEDLDGTQLICEAKVEQSVELARHHYRAGPIEAFGLGKWQRLDGGGWELEHFRIHSFNPLKDEPLRETFTRLRSIPGHWKEKQDPLQELEDIRHGSK